MGAGRAAGVVLGLREFWAAAMRCQEILGDAGAMPKDAEVMSGRCQR